MRVPTILVLDETEDLGRQVGRAIACLRPRPELVVCPSLVAMEESLIRHPAVDVLIAGPSMATPAGLLELRRLRLRLPDISLILVFDRRRTAPLRDTIRTGAVDILRLPLTDAVIVDAILQALEVRWGSLPEGEEGPGPGPGRVGEIIAVVSATGGCGKTFLATNVAYHLHAKRHKRVCLIDLDLQFGELSSALRLKPKLTIIDLLSHDDEKDLSGRLQEHLVVHDTGIPVLAAPERPVEADGVDAADVGRVLDAARRKFDYVIVDTPPSLSEAVLVALEYADRVLAVATLDLPSVRNLGLLLSTMQQLKVPADRVQLVLNKVETDVGMDVDQVTRHFPQGFQMVIPYGRDVNRSLNMGMPLLAFAPGCEVSKVLGAGLATLLPGTPGEDDGNPGRRALFGRRRARAAQADSA
ncbi:MAG: pilus assembly protein CpaE [Actinomycetota bacterium]|jgi:pilus assembly protein CpaE|nr:pilus assembly protein CpaE [Actinomycetota bacterium]